MRVLNEMGAAASKRILSAFPDVEVIEVGFEPPADDLVADVLFGGWGSHSIEYAQHVEWVQLGGTGIDHIPRELLDGRLVACARGTAAIPISEWVLGTMLAFEKRFPDVWLHEPPEHWNFARLGGLYAKSVGIVGFGGIGTAVALRSIPFGMRVLAVRRTEAPSPVDGVELVEDLAALLPEVDHLVLAAPLTPKTRGMIGSEALARVKPGVHLVNVARGGLVDQDALRVALDDGRVAMASLDTVDPEPLPAGHWLYEHPNVRVSAHVSWASHLGFDAPVDFLIANLGRYQRGEALEGVVDADEGY
jgi:phosphoglycerate dehydrogenase-like enzyme